MNNTKLKKEAINELIEDYLLMKFEAEGLMPLIKKKLQRVKTDKKFQTKIGYTLLGKTIDFYTDKKSIIEKGLFVIDNNIAFYKGKLKNK